MPPKGKRALAFKVFLTLNLYACFFWIGANSSDMQKVYPSINLQAIAFGIL